MNTDNYKFLLFNSNVEITKYIEAKDDVQIT